MFDPALKQCFLFAPPDAERDVETNGPEYGLDVVLFTENRHKYHVRPLENPELVATEWEQAGVRITVRAPLAVNELFVPLNAQAATKGGISLAPVRAGARGADTRAPDVLRVRRGARRNGAHRALLRGDRALAARAGRRAQLRAGARPREPLRLQRPAARYAFVPVRSQASALEPITSTLYSFRH